jgi:hypothetical protein
MMRRHFRNLKMLNNIGGTRLTIGYRDDGTSPLDKAMNRRPG